MSSTEQSVTEMIDSLTGWDEIAIEKHFGLEWTDLADSKPIKFARSLIFVDRRREPHSQSDADAKAYAFGLPVGQVNAYFAEEAEEPMPEEPESDQGKDDAQPESGQESKPPSV